MPTKKIIKKKAISSNHSKKLSPKTISELPPIVGIGASAGGLEAISQLFAHLKPDTGLAFAIILHLAPDHPSQVPEIIGRETPMPVVEMKNGMVVKPNHVYIIPASHDATLLPKGRFKLTKRVSPAFPHLPIDDFFTSLAENIKNKSIGIILSGAGSDGTKGLQRIKAEGGITFAQKASTAKHDSMPQSAINTGSVDRVLTVKEMATELGKIANHPYLTSSLIDTSEKTDSTLPELPPQMQDALSNIFNEIRKVTQLDFSQYKAGTIHRRIKRRMLLCKINDLAKYAAYVVNNAEEAKALAEDFLITVTRFFRDIDVFGELKKSVFLAFLKKCSKNTPLRIWVAGCASGEEVYSLAISLMEYFEENRCPIYLRIFGTDISESALQQARAGFYPDSISQHVSKKRLNRYFEKVVGGYRIKKLVREACIFSLHNVISDPPFAKIDLISCRNLLIYFNTELQEHVIPIFHYALNEHGFLWLGSAETLSGYSNLFTCIDKKYRIFEKKEWVHKPKGLALNLINKQPEFYPINFKESKINIQKEADRFILEKFSPPCVLVNSNMEIMTTRGNTEFYLKLSPGQPSFNLMKLTNLPLAMQIRHAIQESKKTNEPVVKEKLLLKGDHQNKLINLKVEPLRTYQKLNESYFFVEFEELALPEDVEKQDYAVAPVTVIENDFKKEALAERHYKALLGQFENAEEELVAANEELQSSNEELQSTNEELETTKEELQSSNEELSTVNDELYEKNAEIIELNNALENLLISIDIPIVLVDSEKRVIHFTPLATKILSLIPADIGRPIIDIKPKLKNVNLDLIFQEVLDKQTVMQMEIQDTADHWYKLVARPYKVTDHKIEGAVISLFDIDDLKRTTALMEQSRDNALAIIDNLPIPVVIIDANYKIELANPSFYKTFRVSPTDTRGETLPTLGDRQWNIPALLKLIDSAMAGTAFKDFEVEQTFPNIGMRTMELNANQISLGSHGKKMVLISIEDITKRKQKEYKKFFDKLTLALDAGQIGTWEYDPALDILLWDPRMYDIYDTAHDAFKENYQSWITKVHPDDVESLDKKFKRFLAEEKSLDVEFRILRSSGEVRYVHVKALSLFDKVLKKNTVIGTTWDITQAELLTNELFNEKQKLVQTLRERDQVNKELESFAYIASHDLKAPLRGIESLTTWIEKDIDNTLTQDSSENLALLRSRVKRMSNLIDGILVYTRAGRIDLNVSTVSIKDLLKEVIDNLPVPETFTIHYPDKLPTFRTAKVPLSQVFSNLISNAIKYNDRKDGRIDISVRDIGSFYEFEIADNGPGIEPEYHDKIFQMFQSLQPKDKIESTGIGLSIVKKIVELNHGKITIESKKGEGTKFRFTWPKE